MIEKWKNYIASETRAKNIEISDKKQELTETWDIEGEQYIIGISKAD
jgi:Isoleucyl-tRNA synthetase (EC 6.1.1.5)